VKDSARWLVNCCDYGPSTLNQKYFQHIFQIVESILETCYQNEGVFFYISELTLSKNYKNNKSKNNYSHKVSHVNLWRLQK